MKNRRQAQILIIALTVLLTSAGSMIFNRAFMQAEVRGSELTAAPNPYGTHQPGVKGRFDAGDYLVESGASGASRFMPAVPDTVANGWDTQFSLPNGLSGQVSAMLASGTNIYVSGGLGGVLNAPPNNYLLKFDTLTQTWTSLGTVSADGAIRVMALSGSDLYVGGFFTTVDVGGTNIPANNVAKLNLTTGVWSALGTGGGQGVSGSVYAMTLSGSDLYVGGFFLTTNVGGATVSANRLARFNTVTGVWSALGTGGGNGVNSNVLALAVSGSDLYVGGSFATANVGGTTVTANGVARVNTLTGVWSALGNGGGQGIGNGVQTMALGGNDLYVGGNLSLANLGGVTVPVNNLAKFNTATGIWSAVGAGGGNGVDAEVSSLLLSGNELYVSGGFTTANVGGAEIGANRIAKLDTSTGVWSALGAGGGNGVSRGSGNGGEVISLAMIGSHLYVAGAFTSANVGGPVINVGNIAKFDTATSFWSGLTEGTGNGLNDFALAVAVNGTDIYVGGIFSFAGAVPANGIAKFDTLTNTWSALGTGGGNGVDGTVQALAVSGGDLYVAGDFTMANVGGATVNVNNVAKVNLATGVWSALGTGGGNGVNSQIRALLVSGSNLYVAGLFTTANVGSTPVSANRVAKFNLATSVWSALGTGGGNGLNSAAYALAVSGGNLYVGGTFATANVGGTTVSANNIARVNLTTGAWSVLGTGGGNGVSGGLGPSFVQGVYALAANGSDLYVGGLFNTANTGGTTVNANYIAKVNLATGVWSALGNGGGNGLNLITEYPAAAALALNGNDLYVAGGFTMANIGGTTVNANSVAKFNTATGNWSALADSGGGNGVNYLATSLGLTGNDVFVSGLFSTAGDNKPSANIARFHTNTAPTISAQAGVSRQKGSPASNGQIATVNDLESGAGGVTVTVTSANPSNGVTISNIVNSDGTVTADVVAACDATNASFTLTATDGDGATATATLNVTATSNTAPVLSYGSPQSVIVGGSVTVSPSAGPSDNGTIASIVLESQGAFTGTISVNNATGEVSISNAAPVGAHTIVVRATDNCGTTTDGSFTLNVSCPAITLSPATLPNAAVGTAYNQSLTATPAGTYSFALISGQLPKGLTLSADGVISGTPTEFGIFNFTVMANGGSCMGSGRYTLTVTGASCAAPNFTNRTDFTAGGAPRSIVAADFNRDGKADLASASDINTNLFVMLGDGLGGFPTSNTITMARTTSDMDTGDFNGDGNIDLVLSSINSSGVTILFGDGAGGFPTSTVVSLGFNQNGVRAADFNRDGKLDFITFASSASNRFFIVLGNGSGGFSIAPGSPVILDFTPNGSVAINDFNEDGRLDVAFRKTSPSQIVVMHGDGNGALTMGTPVNIAANSTGVFTADFNLDGHFDLAVPHSDDSLTLLFGDGSGGFTPAPGSPISGAAASTTADFNGDGIPDLASPSRVGFGNGSGGFTILNSLNTGSNRFNVAVADLNGDGKSDLAVVNYGPNKVVVVFNNCAPQITAAAPIERQQGSPVANAQIATVGDQETAAGNLTVTATSVPSGLTVTNIVNTGGVITADVAANCAITPGAKTVVLRVSDGVLTTTANLTVNVTANTAPSLTYPASANITVGGSTTINPITATDNVSITGYSIVSVMPALTTAPAVDGSGAVSITNAAPSGSHVITVRAMDNCGATTDASFTLNVDCASVTVSPLNPNLTGGTAGTPYSQSFSAAGGASPYSFTVSAGTLPAGLTLDSGGLLSGTPTGFGNFSFTVRATDANGCFGERAYSIRICGVISLTGTLPGGTTGVAYNQTITVSGGASPYSFAVTGGNLPPGLSLNNSGALTGTPTNNGSFNFTVTATDNLGCTGTQSYTVSIGCQTVIINQTTLPNGFVGTSYNQTLTATGGTAPYSFAVSAGALPEGVTLSSGGALSGTPTTQASYSFTIRATDANGCFGEQAFTVLVSGNGLMFYPLPSPVRLLDTRTGFSGCTTGVGALAAGSTRTQAARTACSTIPANATAIIGNITVVPSGPGYLTLFPSDATQPTVANSNFTAGEVTNNFFTVGLGTSGADAGAFKIFTSATTDVIIDVTGYYAPPAANGLFYHPLPSPVRLVETRSGQSGCFQPAQLQGSNDPNANPGLDLQVQGRSPGLPSPCNSIPSDAVVLVGNATTVLPNAPLGFGYLTIYPSDATRPTVASSNYATNDVINGPFAVKLGADGKFKIYTFSTTDLVVDISGYYSASPTDANGAGLLFSPLPKPMRLLETRPDFPGFPLTGCYRTNAPIAGQPNVRTQPVWGTCSDQPITIPNTARAIAGNVTAINPAAAGFLTFFPGDVATAPTVATSNYPFPVTFGYNRHYFVGLSAADGNFKALSQFTTDLIVDVAGFFAP